MANARREIWLEAHFGYSDYVSPFSLELRQYRKDDYLNALREIQGMIDRANRGDIQLYNNYGYQHRKIDIEALAVEAYLEQAKESQAHAKHAASYAKRHPKPIKPRNASKKPAKPRKTKKRVPRPIDEFVVIVKAKKQHKVIFKTQAEVDAFINLMHQAELVFED